MLFRSLVQTLAGVFSVADLSRPADVKQADWAVGFVVRERDGTENRCSWKIDPKAFANPAQALPTELAAALKSAWAEHKFISVELDGNGEVEVKPTGKNAELAVEAHDVLRQRLELATGVFQDEMRLSTGLLTVAVSDQRTVLVMPVRGNRQVQIRVDGNEELRNRLEIGRAHV